MYSGSTRTCIKYCTKAPTLKPLEPEMTHCSFTKLSWEEEADAGFPENSEAILKHRIPTLHQRSKEVIFKDLHTQTKKRAANLFVVVVAVCQGGHKA